MRNLFAAVAALVALLAIVFSVRSYLTATAPLTIPGSGGPATLTGAPAESFAVERLGGGSEGIADYRGRVVLVNLWASWCSPCREETPALEKLYRAERGRGLVVLGIDQGESASAAAKFVAEMHLTYPILLDEDQHYGRAYEALGLPTTLVVDRAGRIVFGHDGQLTLAQMRAAVDPALRAE
ncbi:MAG: TlpA family protein disulfide reductase [Vulcanimicrobiaceae bacterium]